MSLYDRAKRAEATLDRSLPKEDELLGRLREQIQADLPVDRLAQLSRENPQYARNEVRSACRCVFDRAEWYYVDEAMRECLVTRLLDSIFGFGILEDLIADEAITEVIVNGPDNIFFEKDGTIHKTQRHFASESDLRTLMDRIVGPLGRRIDEASPMVNARLPQGHRVNIVIPPIALDGPYLTIRKFTEHVITLDEMRESGTLEPLVQTFLVWAVRARKSIAVCGGTGSGKTTLLNALSCVIDPAERIVTIEDSAELRFFHHPDVARMEARPRNAEGSGEVTIRELVMNALRMRPDRIIVGECRGAEALDMLQAMNTGHEGSLTTLHANSPEDSIARLTTLVRYGADLPIDVIESNIASALHLAVQMRRDLDGKRRIAQIVRFSFDRNQGRCDAHTIYDRPIGSEQGSWLEAPAWIEELELRNIASAEEVAVWKHACCL